MRALRLSLSLLLACLLVAGAASAQPKDLVPPEIVAREPPPYPEGRTEAASVVIEIVVEADGTVSETRVIEGDGVFADAAEAAVKRWRFKPATRNGEPARARIRVAVDFTPPPPAKLTPPPEPPPAPKPERPADRPAPPGVEEVLVQGRREVRSPTEHRIGRAEIRVIPGAFGDPFRAIDVLPSVVPIISGLPYFYVRGAPPSAVGFYIDEVRVPYLFHFALGPGVIHPAIIEEVSLHPAAFPARYGRYAGGIVAGQLRDPATKLYGEAQIRFYDAGAYVETPLANGRATFGLGGRYSYTGAIISLVAPDVTIDYRDYNARASYRLSDRWVASAVAIGAYDYTSDKERGVEVVRFASEFHRLDMRFDRRGSDGGTSRIAATVGIDRTRIEAARFAQNFVTGVRGRHRWAARSDVDAEIGADVWADFYSGDLPNRYSVRADDYREAQTLFSPRVDTATGVWAMASYHPWPGWDFTGTLRADAFTSAGKVALGPSPRLSTQVPLTKKLSFLAAMGVAPQPPAFSIPVPAVGYSGLPGGLAFAYQKSGGFELALPWRFTWRTVGFHHSYFNMRDFARDRGRIEFEESRIAVNSPAQAFGLEMRLARSLAERYSAFAALTVARAELGSSQLEPTRVSPFDRTYVFQVGGVADLGRGWRFSTRFLTYGGWPHTPEPEDPVKSSRLSAFRRLDIRIEKRWTLAHDRWIALVLEGLNVFLSKDVVGRNCSSGNGCRDDDIGPVVVPSLGVEGGL